MNAKFGTEGKTYGIPSCEQQDIIGGPWDLVTCPACVRAYLAPTAKRYYFGVCPHCGQSGPDVIRGITRITMYDPQMEQPEQEVQA